MEPYSADKIKPKKRKNYNFEPVWAFTYHPPLLFKNKQDIIEPKEFKKRDPEFQHMMRKEFDQLEGE